MARGYHWPSVDTQLVYQLVVSGVGKRYSRRTDVRDAVRTLAVPAVAANLPIAQYALGLSAYTAEPSRTNREIY